DGLYRGRLYTTLPVALSGFGGLVRIGRPWHHVGVGEPVVGAVGLRVLGRCLARDLGDVIVEAVVTYGVVVLQELALRAQGPVQVGGDRAGPERGLVALVLELDD